MLRACASQRAACSASVRRCTSAATAASSALHCWSIRAAASACNAKQADAHCLACSRCSAATLLSNTLTLQSPSCQDFVQSASSVSLAAQGGGPAAAWQSREGAPGARRAAPAPAARADGPRPARRAESSAPRPPWLRRCCAAAHSSCAAHTLIGSPRCCAAWCMLVYWGWPALGESQSMRCFLFMI